MPQTQIIRAASDPAISPSDIAIVDGDTIRARGRMIRLVGFDTPEVGLLATCERERDLAQRASARLKALVAGGRLELRLVPCSCPPGTEGMRECNHGRACGVLTAGGGDVGSTLISEGLAKPYVCGTTSCPRRPSWCQRRFIREPRCRSMPVDAERTKQLREKLLEHLEAALAIADETQDGDAGFRIEQALDYVRAAHWPTLDPNLELFRKGKR